MEVGKHPFEMTSMSLKESKLKQITFKPNVQPKMLETFQPIFKPNLNIPL
tara:strand:- start:349 stop:498 length:150 start_codon:yes stop_codon:yes gene_type:complete